MDPRLRTPDLRYFKKKRIFCSTLCLLHSLAARLSVQWWLSHATIMIDCTFINFQFRARQHRHEHIVEGIIKTGVGF